MLGWLLNLDFAASEAETLDIRPPFDARWLDPVRHASWLDPKRDAEWIDPERHARWNDA